MITSLSPERFLEVGLPIIDVRSPSEFLRGHIPNAHNLPLFTDEERAQVGTLYRREGRDRAMVQGLHFVGPRLAVMVEQAKALGGCGGIAVHCWRGGERSKSVAWLFDKAGFDQVVLLHGGYKQFRKHVLSCFEPPLMFKVIGGYTGSGKTETLALLERAGEQVIDLEGLAEHKGSAFGGLGMKEQPSTEHFENLLWSELASMDPDRPVWLEDESQMIGKVKIPDPFFRIMRSSELFFVDMPLAERAERLVQDYGAHDRKDLAAAIERIAKRMGPQHVKNALEALDAGDLYRVALLALGYYDKTYFHGLSKRDPARVSRITVKASDLDHLVVELKAHGTPSPAQQ